MAWYGLSTCFCDSDIKLVGLLISFYYYNYVRTPLPAKTVVEYWKTVLLLHQKDIKVSRRNFMTMIYSKWITPFLRQCFVTSGVSLNMANSGFVLGFSTVLLPQLKQPDSVIQIDNSLGSWIAALPAITIIVGNFIVPPIMGNFGRKIANLVSICISIIAWLCVILSDNIAVLLTGRFINGVSMGMTFALGPVLIGEYTSPRNRGVFLSMVTISIGIGVLFIHSFGSYLKWQTTSIICIGIVVLNLLIVILSPESPTFLAGKGKYDECRKVFRYLRGESEDDELEKMIACSKIIRSKDGKLETRQTCGAKLQTKIDYFLVTIRKREFYKPILIVIHFFIMAQWSGVNTLTSYTGDLIINVVGTGFDISVMVIALQLNRLAASIVGLIMIKRVKRRKILFVVVSLNVAINLAIAVYSFIKENGYLSYDYAEIGLTLIHMQMIVITIGAMPLSYILAGELYPMEHKSLCGGIGTIFLSLSTFANVKTVPLMFSTIGVYGSYLIHSAIIVYCMVFVGLSLPETKDKTLQDIEEEFKEKKILQK